jgi:hypothetical protein
MTLEGLRGFSGKGSSNEVPLLCRDVSEQVNGTDGEE